MIQLYIIFKILYNFLFIYEHLSWWFSSKNIYTQVLHSNTPICMVSELDPMWASALILKNEEHGPVEYSGEALNYRA